MVVIRVVGKHEAMDNQNVNKWEGQVDPCYREA